MAWKTKLIARAAEMAALEHELRLAAAGRFRSVLLLGDPGVGKTRLATELALRNRRRTVGLFARAYPLGETAPFGLWAQALERHLRSLKPEEVAELCGGFLEDLAVLLRSAASALGTAPVTEPPRGRLLEGLAVLLRNLALETPVVAVLDDMHHADPSSWEALHYVGQNVPDARLLVVMAATPAELSEQRAGTEVLLHLEQDQITRRLKITELSRDSLRELAASMLRQEPPDALVSWLEDRSRGNPFFAIELLEALVDEGAELDDPKLRVLPEGLKERVRNRLRLLDEPAFATLELLAVLGCPVETIDLVALSDRAAGRLGDILEELVRCRLVNEVERGCDVTFEIAHPLVQEAVYQGIGSIRRKALHRVIGRVLLEAGRLDEAALHFARSAQKGDAQAIDVLREALRQAEERRTFQEGVTILGLLAGLLPPADPRWADILECMSWEAEWTFRSSANAAEAIRAMRRIDSVLEESADPARRAMVKLRLANFQTWGTGTLDDAERDCDEAIGLFEQAGNTPRALFAASELATIRGLRGDLPRMEHEIDRIVQLAAASGERFVEMQASGALGWNLFHRGAFEPAEEAMRRSAEIATELDSPYRWATALGVQALCAAWDGRVDDALALLEQVQAAGPHLGDLFPEVDASVHWIAGDFRAAVRSTNRALALRPELSRRRGFCLWCASLAAVELDQLAESRRFMRRARAIYGNREFLFYPELRDYTEAIIDFRSGDRGSTLATLRRVADQITDVGVLPSAAFVLVDLIELAAIAGEGGYTADAAAQLDDIARTVGGPLYAGLAAIGAAWTSLERGAVLAAAREAEEAEILLGKTGCRAYRGRAADVAAQSLAPIGADEAIPAFQRAVSLFDACGAVWRRDRALQALKALGPAGRRTAAAALGPGSLTPRELEVARFAALGSTAREIGSKLFVSDRTVESHLASAYAKLGVQGRVALARRLAELDI